MKTLDYSKIENWIINKSEETDKTYDLIFLYGTSVTVPTQENGVGDVSKEMGILATTNFTNCGKALSEDARVFVPYYRQMAVGYIAKNYFTHNDGLEDLANKEPYYDAAAALDYYFENYNQDGKRPFVLVGFSQGAMVFQMILANYFLATEKRKYLKNMVAIYSIGYGISKKYYDELPNKDGLIHFVTGADDYNCIISWNTEGPGDKGQSFLLADEGDTTLLINPLNWKTDDTYAGIEENLGVLVNEGDLLKPVFHFSNEKEDLQDGYIDLERGSIICSTNTDYAAFPGFPGVLWGGKSLHFYEGRGYYNNIKENIKVRVNNFINSKK